MGDIKPKLGYALEQPPLKDVKRFLEFVVQPENDDCWLWNGCIARRPQFWYERRAHWAARFSYAAFNGAIPMALDVHHTCGNSLCVNPEHLELLTRESNQAIGEGQELDIVPF